MSHSAESESSNGDLSVTQTCLREFSTKELISIIAQHAGWLAEEMDPQGDVREILRPYANGLAQKSGASSSELYAFRDDILDKLTDEARRSPKRADLQLAKLGGANLNGANLHCADLRGADIREADIRQATLSLANLSRSNLNKSDLAGTDLSDADLSFADLSEADLRVNLRGANLAYAILSSANLALANLTGADLRGTLFSDADLSQVKWSRTQMRGKCAGIRGLDSCYGNALFRRDAADQDYLDTLKTKWLANRWRMFLFWCWGKIDYGRSLFRVFGVALILIVIFGITYFVSPGLLGETMIARDYDFFTPYYFSIVTFTTLGFGEINPKGHLVGEIVVSCEVLLGYCTLGLLLSVLSEKVARRS